MVSTRRLGRLLASVTSEKMVNEKEKIHIVNSYLLMAVQVQSFIFVDLRGLKS